MKISTILFISARYIYSSGGRYLSSVMSTISIVGTGLSVAILLCIMSIMNGFEDELKSRMLAPGSHLEVFTDQNSENSEAPVLSHIRADQRVSRADLVIEGDALISDGEIFRAAILRGLNPNDEFLEEVFLSRLITGSIEGFRNSEFGILLGHELAESLGVTYGDKVTVILPQPIMSPIGLLARTKRFQVSGVFKFNVNAPDASLAVVRYSKAEVFFPKAASSKLISVTLKEPEKASFLVASLKSQYDIKVHTWKEKYSALFMALRIEKLVMFGMLLMAVFIALLNMTSILLVNVTSKKKDIAILIGFGLTKKQAAGVFFIQGFVTGLIGITLGVLLGIMLSLNLEGIVSAVEHALSFRVLSPEIYYVSKVPSNLLVRDVVSISVISVISVFFAALVPAVLSVRLSKIRGLGRE